MRHVEQLETRRLLSSFTASSVAELIGDMNAANAAGGSNTITLAAGSTFKLNAVDNQVDGPTGLPVIAPGDDLTIVGNGDSIERSSGGGTPAFRLFDVAAGGLLSLSNLTLSRGLADTSFFGTAEGGAIRSQGTLGLSGVTIQNCIAQGDLGVSAAGGGIYSSGVLTVADSVIRNNNALGGGGISFGFLPGIGAAAAGGGLYVGGGTATVMNTTFYSNLARGGDGADGGKFFFFFSSFWIAGGRGGNGLGGGIYADAGTVTLQGSTLTRNAAQAGAGGSTPKGLTKPADAVGQGGGLYIYPSALVSLDAFTQSNTKSNTASTSDDDIFGSFSVLP